MAVSGGTSLPRTRRKVPPLSHLVPKKQSYLRWAKDKGRDHSVPPAGRRPRRREDVERLHHRRAVVPVLGREPKLDRGAADGRVDEAHRHSAAERVVRIRGGEIANGREVTYVVWRADLPPLRESVLPDELELRKILGAVRHAHDPDERAARSGSNLGGGVVGA